MDQPVICHLCGEEVTTGGAFVRESATAPFRRCHPSCHFQRFEDNDD